MQRCKKKNIVVISFFVTAMLYLVAATISHYNPLFGGSVLMKDLNQQYLSFFSFYKQAMLGQTDWSYSFSSGLGSGMFGNWAYYFLSPFNLIFLLFKDAQFPSVFFIIILLKLSLTSSSFACYLKRRYTTIRPVIQILLATSYGLMSFSIAYQTNIMWLDGIIALPLMILGISELIINNKVKLYSLSLAYALITNYYIGYMLCLFSVFYFVYLYIVRYTTLKNRRQVVINYICSSIISGLIAAIILLPTYASLSQGKLALTNPVTNKILFRPWLALVNLTIGSNNEQFPYIFIGSMALVGSIGYFFSTNIGIKNKLYSIIFSLILVSGTFMTPIYLFWHGFQFPQGYPERFVFLVSFWLLDLAAQFFNQNQAISKKIIMVMIAIFTGVILYLGVRIKQFMNLGYGQLLLSMLSIVIALVVIYKLPKLRDRTILIMVSYFMLELLLNASLIEIKQPATVSGDSYSSYHQELIQTYDKLPSRKVNNFYRIEKTYRRGTDRGDSFQTNTAGASIFSSNFSGNVTEFYKKMGLPAYGYWLNYVNGTKVTDSLLGIRYLVMSEQKKSDSFRNYERNDLDGTSLSYKFQINHNDKALSLGFMANKDGSNIENYTLNNPLENQNKLMQNLSGDHKLIFKRIPLEQVVLNDAIIKDTGFYKQLEKTSSKGSVTIQYNNLQPGKIYYLLVDSSLKKAIITVNGKQLEMEPNAVQPTTLGFKAEKSTVKINIATNQENFQYHVLELYEFDQTSYNHMFDKLKKNEFQVDSINKNRFDGHLTVRKNTQELITTIPYEPGWTVQVDGTNKKIKKVMGAFVGMELTPGEHKITFSYHVPLIRIGLVISIIGLCCLYGLAKINDIQKIKRNK